MSITNLRLDESVKLEFDVLITGADGIPKSSFVIEGKDYSISFPCRQVSEGVEVDISGLKNVLPAGEYPVRLEVVLENRIYVPMQDTIKLEPVVEINTKKKITTEVKENVELFGKVKVIKKNHGETDTEYSNDSDALFENIKDRRISEASNRFSSLKNSFVRKN